MGEDVNVDEFIRIGGALGRILKLLGLERTARDVTPDPLQYAQRRSRDAVDVEEVDDES
jgi:hypothetical protein